MNVYERDLQRLVKAEKLVDLATHSGTLKDRNWKQPLDTSAQYAWAALACLQLVIKNQKDYTADKAKPYPLLLQEYAIKGITEQGGKSGRQDGTL